jgi:hypothetical protein
MFDTSHSAEASAYTAESAAGSSASNTTTKAKLLKRAKAAIEAGEQSLQEAAEALGLAEEDHSATQREMAEAVGKSASWVNKLLKWRRSGYKEHSPFGPTTKRGRVEHAQQPHKAREPKPRASGGDLDGSTERRNTEYTAKEAKTPPSTVTSALDGFKSAVDYWFPMMDCNTIREAVNYAVAQSKVQVSCPTV